MAVVSQPPKPAGRGMRVHKTPVHERAESLNLPVLTPQRARDQEFIEQVRSLSPDLIVLASYGKILPQSLLEIASLGNWNLHASLLPKYRGASPIQYAILNGETETGVTLMEMVREMDAGDIYLQVAEPIFPDDDYGSLEARLAQRAAELLLEGLRHLQAGTLTRTPQDHTAATYAPLITKEECHIRWDEPAERCRNRIRAFSPKPGAYAFWRGKMLKIWRAEVALTPVPSPTAWERGVAAPRAHAVGEGSEGTPSPLDHAVGEGGRGGEGTILSVDPNNFLVACGTGVLRLLEVQPESRPRMDIRAFVNGYRPQVGERLE
ncbi:MAG: methionyl-tRNA formyltransferase [Fimbriimonadales bacterium]|nr:MAG: methionyl-tRNA formyltransferase [Fimbriimonadales bacterium]